MTAKEIIQSRYSCTCGEIYTSRKKKAPDCTLCQYKEEIEDMMNEFAKQQAIEFAKYTENTSFHEKHNVWIKNAKSFTSDELYDKFMEEKK